jgi:hypothetical protein
VGEHTDLEMAAAQPVRPVPVAQRALPHFPGERQIHRLPILVVGDVLADPVPIRHQELHRVEHAVIGAGRLQLDRVQQLEQHWAMRAVVTLHQRGVVVAVVG